NKKYINVSRATELKYYETFISPLIEKYAVYAEGFDIKTLKEEATPILTLNYVQNGESHIQLGFQYGEYVFSPTSDQKVSVRMSYDEQNDQYTFTRIKRSVLWENNQHNLLEELGLKRQDALFGSYFTDKIDFPNVFEWLNSKQEELLAKGYNIKQETGDKQFFIGKTT